MRTCNQRDEKRVQQLARSFLLTLLLAGCQTNPSPREAEPPPEPTAPATSAADAAETPASAPERPPSDTAAPSPAVGTTAQERVEALDRALETSYEEHDALLRDQQASNRAEAAEIAAQRTDSGGDADTEAFEQGGLYEGLPGFGTPPPEASADTDSDTGSDGEVTTRTIDAEDAGTALTSGTRDQPGGQSGGAAIPTDIPDGRDDDIVARQLREAAQMEKDPALRAKLWDEYRKYKNQQTTP